MVRKIVTKAENPSENRNVISMERFSMEQFDGIYFDILQNYLKFMINRRSKKWNLFIKIAFDIFIKTVFTKQ